jgi:hypothetical protein
MYVLASGAPAVNSAHGGLLLLAVVLFLAAAIVAFITLPVHRAVLVLTALGLAALALSGLWN